MILDFQKIELLDKTVFKRIKFKPPISGAEIMESEACMLYAVNGTSDVYGSDKTSTISTDECVLMKCGNFISKWKVTEEVNPYEAITIHFFPDVLKFIFENSIPEYLQYPINNHHRVFQKIQKNVILKSYIDGLLVYFDNPKLFNTDTIKLKLRELIAILYQLDSEEVREILSDMFNPHQVEFKKVVTAHVFHNLSMEEFATLMNLSVSTFRRKFKEIYNSSPGQYIIGTKLERAAQLLSSTNQRVSDVCYECGFGDLSNFTKTFSRKYGVSPSEYRERG
ncbi:helix-turn-helix domain-containing protein [Spongiimicrobium sp. 2-473A-2-J]|uniref:helix-turn-helix domain-containing protein n=1 Tax=Eudoraea algarum TaxID=3417568 RepID=UPI003D35EAF9